MRYALIALALLGCKSEHKPSGLVEEKPKPVDKPVEGAAETPTDPACAAKAKELEPFLAQLGLETASGEVNFGWTPVAIDRTASPVDQNVDYLIITPKTVSAYDVSEANHVDNNIGPKAKPAAIEARLKTVFDMKGKERDEGPAARIRIDVDAATTWDEVAAVVGAAAKVGYTQAVFAFETTDKLTPPVGLPAKIDNADVTKAAGKRLQELQDSCKPWRSAVLNHKYGPTKAENAKLVAKETAEAIAKCNCAADPDEVRKAVWQHDRWHQAHTRGPVEVKLAADGTKLEQPKATPWSDAHKKLLEAAPEGGAAPALVFVAK